MSGRGSPCPPQRHLPSHTPRHPTKPPTCPSRCLALSPYLPRRRANERPQHVRVVEQRRTALAGRQQVVQVGKQLLGGGGRREPAGVRGADTRVSCLASVRGRGDSGTRREGSIRQS